MPSFDIVSQVDMQEVGNAVDQEGDMIRILALLLVLFATACGGGTSIAPWSTRITSADFPARTAARRGNSTSGGIAVRRTLLLKRMDTSCCGNGRPAVTSHAPV